MMKNIKAIKAITTMNTIALSPCYSIIVLCF